MENYDNEPVSTTDQNLMSARSITGSSAISVDMSVITLPQDMQQRLYHLSTIYGG